MIDTSNLGRRVEFVTGTFHDETSNPATNAYILYYTHIITVKQLLSPLDNNPPDKRELSAKDLNSLAEQIRHWGLELGFQQVGFCDIDLAEHEARLNDWLSSGFHGEMEYMQRHAALRADPDALHPGTIRVISARMDYLPKTRASVEELLEDPQKAIVSRYALGRDYHKMMRKRLKALAQKVEKKTGPMGYRVFVDSAPVLEKALAEKSGLGWIGKHSNLINKQTGSWFFLGEIFTDLPLPVDQPATEHCGACTRCIDVCPTQAIIAPFTVDARRCISYLTIELRTSIPEELRAPMGNRIYGCDDCQLVCPWNRFARFTGEADFAPRNDLDTPELAELFAWDKDQFLKLTEGSAIRRIGHECWLRNIAVALGNATDSKTAVSALVKRLEHPSEMVREHVRWALGRHESRVK